MNNFCNGVEDRLHCRVGGTSGQNFPPDNLGFVQNFYESRFQHLLWGKFNIGVCRFVGCGFLYSVKNWTLFNQAANYLVTNFEFKASERTSLGLSYHLESFKSCQQITQIVYFKYPSYFTSTCLYIGSVSWHMYVCAIKGSLVYNTISRR